MAWETSTQPRATLPAARRQLLVAGGNGVELFGKLPQLLVQRDDVGQMLLDFVAALDVGGALDFEVAQVDEGVQIFDFLADLLADFDGAELDQRRTADGLLHPQLAALHAAGKIDFAFAGEQRDGAHFAQIHAYRVVGIDRLFYRMGSRKLFGIMDFLRMEEAPFFIEGKP